MNVAGRPTRTIWPAADGAAVEIIDQTRLPHTFTTVRMETLADAARAIGEALESSGMDREDFQVVERLAAIVVGAEQVALDPVGIAREPGEIPGNDRALAQEAQRSRRTLAPDDMDPHEK